METQYWIILIKANNESYILIDKSAALGFHSESRAIGYFSNTYSEAFARGMGASAAIHWLMFSPRVAPVYKGEDINDWLVRDDNGIIFGYNIVNVSGSLSGAKLTADAAAMLESREICVPILY